VPELRSGVHTSRLERPEVSAHDIGARQRHRREYPAPIP
jgi:hypothetical protein